MFRLNAEITVAPTAIGGPNYPLSMASRDIKAFSATVDVPFDSSIPFDQKLLRETVERLNNALGFSIHSDFVRLRTYDVLYGYELAASFYGGNGVFERSANRMLITLKNGRTDKDAALILGVLGKIGPELLFDVQAAPIVTLHAGFEQSPESLARYKDVTIPPEGIACPGHVGYLKPDGMQKFWRILIEPSLGGEPVFLATLVAHLPSSDNWDDSLGLIVRTFKDLLSMYGVEMPDQLSIEPPEEPL